VACSHLFACGAWNGPDAVQLGLVRVLLPQVLEALFKKWPLVLPRLRRQAPLYSPPPRCPTTTLSPPANAPRSSGAPWPSGSLSWGQDLQRTPGLRASKTGRPTPPSSEAASRCTCKSLLPREILLAQDDRQVHHNFFRFLVRILLAAVQQASSISSSLGRFVFLKKRDRKAGGESFFPSLRILIPSSHWETPLGAGGSAPSCRPRSLTVRRP